MENINFRYRGPLESEKCNKMEIKTIETLNKLITKVKGLVDNTESTSNNIITLVKRRGT